MPVEFRPDGKVGFHPGEQRDRTISPLQAIQESAHIALRAASWDLISYASSKLGELSPSRLTAIYREETHNKCIVAAALTGAVLTADYPEVFSKMAILRSEVTTRPEWDFDTYLIAQVREDGEDGKDGRWYAVSPAVHRIPDEGAPLFTIHEGETLEKLLESIQNKHPSWSWPNANFIRENMHEGLPEFTSESTLRIQMVSLDAPVGWRRRDNLKRHVIHMDLATGEPVLEKTDGKVQEALRRGKNLLLRLSDNIGRMHEAQMPEDTREPQRPQ